MWPFGFGGLPFPRLWPRLNGQEARRFALQPGRHRDRVGIDREVHERAPPERDVLRIAVLSVLLDRVLDGLAGEVVLQLRRRHRDAVEEEAEVDRLGGVGVERQLPRDGQAVGVVVLHQLRRDAERGLPVGQPDLNVLIAHTMPQHIDGPALVDLPGEALDETPPGERVVTAVRLDELLPLLPLRLFDECEQLARCRGRAPGRSPLATPGPPPILQTR